MERLSHIGVFFFVSFFDEKNKIKASTCDSFKALHFVNKMNDKIRELNEGNDEKKKTTTRRNSSYNVSVGR